MSYTNFDLVEVRTIGADHKSIYARRSIPDGTLLGCFDGEAMVAELADLETQKGTDSFFWRQSVHLRIVGTQLLYLLPVKEPDGVDYLNHNCRANARVEDQLYVYAAREIAAGEEILADYRTFNLVSEDIPCWCPEPRCLI
ncbi:SET domain-containing protein [Flaviflagellibacter deserti]|jgi:uncharacterized protein|uniref:SET domain-containing protein n=1 Tax=Flaviflagellibacter deserti TaxID=2267266 RepID=A0ABV9YZ50_9HYPH